jgi:hypothetical protein
MSEAVTILLLLAITNYLHRNRQRDRKTWSTALKPTGQ